MWYEAVLIKDTSTFLWQIWRSKKRGCPDKNPGCSLWVSGQISYKTQKLEVAQG